MRVEGRFMPAGEISLDLTVIGFTRRSISNLVGKRVVVQIYQILSIQLVTLSATNLATSGAETTAFAFLHLWFVMATKIAKMELTKIRTTAVAAH